MAVNTQDRRRAAQSTHWAPLHPVADNKPLNGSDRRIVLGVYPGPSLYMFGSATGASGTQGALELVVAIQLVGSASGISGTQGALRFLISLISSVSATSSIVASLLVATQLTGTAAATSSVTGRIEGTSHFLQGVITGVSSTTGTLESILRATRFYERTANQITRYFQGIADSNSFVVRYDNDPSATPTDNIWYLASVDFGVANQYELSVGADAVTPFRVVGNFSIRSQNILGAGIGTLIENSDTITTAFRSTNLGEITFGTPRVNNTGRIGDNFRVNITCPFFVDKVVV